MGEGERVIGYVRVSTVGQGDSGAGLEAQRQAIAAECERRGWKRVAIEEDVHSGRKRARPGLERTLRAVRSGEIAGIVVAKLDRLSRSIVHFGDLLAEAREQNWNIVALDFGLDLSTPQGKLVANVLMSVAEWEREVIGQRTREGLAVKRAQGVRLGRPRELPPETRTYILQLRKKKVKGKPWGWSKIARQLNDEGVPTARGGKRWYPASVRAALNVQPEAS